MILTIITETTVNLSLKIEIKDIETIFFQGFEFFLIIRTDKDKIRLKFEIGYKEYSQQEENLKKSDEKLMENTLFFAASIWRMNFLKSQGFLRTIKLPDIKLVVNVKLANTNYLFDILKKIHDEGLKDLTKLIPIKKGETKKIKKSEDLFCSTYFMINNANKSFEFVNQNFGYLKVIIKFFRECLVIYDFYNDYVCSLELSNIFKVAINESRLVVVIYFKYESEYHKIVLFTHQIDDQEFELFKPIYVYFIEANR